MGKTININNLSKEEINSFYDFVCDYELNIKNKYGNYNLNDTKLIAFCATNHIALKNKRSKLPYLFWFTTHQDKRTKINDKAHHLMRHIRNAFAHGLIKKEGKNFTFQDYSTIGTQTMGGHIRCDLFWAMLDLLKHTKL